MLLTGDQCLELSWKFPLFPFPKRKSLLYLGFFSPLLYSRTTASGQLDQLIHLELGCQSWNPSSTTPQLCDPPHGFVRDSRIEVLIFIFQCVCMFICLQFRKSLPLIVEICSIFLPPDGIITLDYKICYGSSLLIGLETKKHLYKLNSCKIPRN